MASRTPPTTPYLAPLLAAAPLLLGSSIACEAAAQRIDFDAPPITMDSPLVPAVIIQGPESLVIESTTLRQRMSESNVPGMSIAVVIDGEVAWAEGFGFADLKEQRKVTHSTLFQAASISKPVAAAGAMRLVEMGILELDRNLDDYLTSWEIPEPTFEDAWDRTGSPVTLRRLLNHTAGTTVRGFPGYERDSEVPSTVGVLDGRGNTESVVLSTVPGTKHQYSGGGYTIAQLAMTDASELPDEFPSLMFDLVLEPLGMSNSTFEQPLPEPLHERAATGYKSDGWPLEGSWVVHPEMAAAGLWTTPTDLAIFFASLQRGMDGQDGPLLTAESVRSMLNYDGDVRYGLGLNVGSERIGHGGGNRGFRCVATFFNEGGDGVVIMSNGDNGWGVNSDVLRTIFVNLDWPGLRPIEKVVVELSREQLERCAGRYIMPGENGSFDVKVDEQGLGLTVSAPGTSPFRLYPEFPSVFFDPDDGVPITFDGPEEGPATEATWSGMTAIRDQ
ncbi:MAG: serine hydrolase [Planctomycetota bacterium]